MRLIRPAFFTGLLLFFTVITAHAQLVFNAPPANISDIDCFESLPVHETLTATGGCDSTAAVTVVATIDPYTVDACSGYPMTYRWIATDNCGDSIQIIRTFHVLADEVEPTILNPPADIMVDLNNGDTIPAVALLDAIDHCSGNQIATTSNEVIIPNSSGYSLTRNWFAFDDCGNASEVMQWIMVIELNDTPAVTFNTQPAVIADIFCDMALPTQETLTATGGCDNNAAVTVTSSIDPYTVDLCGGYTITYRWRATDVCGDYVETTQSFSGLPDVSPPVISNVPPDMTVDLNAGGVIPFQEIPDVVDDCSYSQEIITTIDESYVPTSDGYHLLRSWTSTDPCGNATEESQVITVIEVINTSTPLVFGNEPADILNITCLNELPTQETLTATGGCDSTAAVTVVATIDPYTINACNGYPMTYRWIATDICGDSIQIIRTFHVLADEVGPTILNAPANIEIDFNAGDTIPAVVLLDAIDHCSGNQITTTSNDVISQNASGYNLFRSWFAFDDCGNASEVMQWIKVIELTPTPEITFNTQPALIPDITCDIALPTQETLTATGGCDNNAAVTVTKTVDPYTVDLCGGYVITYRWRATDVCGEYIETTQSFNRLPDSDAPFISSLPADRTVDLTNGDTIPTMEILDAADSCSDIQISSDEITVQTSTGYDLIRTWTVTDACSNPSQATQTITVIDAGTNPAGIVFTFVPADSTVICGATVDFEEPTVTTDCAAGGLVVEYTDETENVCGTTSTTTREWTATDSCGNIVFASASITMIDEMAPEFAGAAELYVDLLAGEGLPELADLVNVVDNCSDSIALTHTKTETLTVDGYDVVYDWTAMDNCGNIGMFSQILHVTGGMIWPGDTDSNKVVNYADIFNIGFGFEMTGEARDNPTLDFLPQYTEPWTSNGMNSTNLRHADTDGNGIIDLQDLAAVLQNLDRSHNLQDSERGDTRESFMINFLYQEITDDNWVHVDVILGDDAETIYDFYGAGFIIEYDQSIVKAGSAHVAFSDSWAGTFFEDFIAIQKDNYDEGQINVGITRINQQGIDGQGKIASFRFQLKEGVDLSAFNLTARGGSGVYASREPYNLETIETVITANRETVLSASAIRVFPNPTNERLNIVVPESIQPKRIQLLNANGQLVRATTKFSDAQLDVNGLGQGIYILQVVTEEGIWSERVTIMK